MTPEEMIKELIKKFPDKSFRFKGETDKYYVFASFKKGADLNPRNISFSPLVRIDKRTNRIVTVKE